MMVRFFFSLLVFVAVETSAPAAAGKPQGALLGPVSRKAPAVYAEKLAPLLTPVKAVMAKRGDFPAKGSDGMLLLDEIIIHTDEQGARILVYHTVEEAFTEAGVETLAEETHSYRTEGQSIHLIQARTILPDGTELPIEDRAVFLESPQSDAADSVYGDRGQLRMIFSGIRPGVLREVIVVVEEPSPRIPGHFSAQEYWGAFWPERLVRTVLVMPDSVANRLSITTQGSGVPVPVKQKWQDGWRMWTWTKEKLPPQRYEPGRPPSDQVGPAALMTTLPDWATFGAWYRELLEQRSSLPPALKQLARECTKDAQTVRDKIDAIVTRVARDLRYTGLEFGLGALQPRPAEEIWKTGYGDCKDKANLATLLLREIGLEAYLVLLQTDHAGLVAKSCPDYRHFNHAILVVETEEGRLFCDPTIRYGKPGMLSATSSDREVLIIKKSSVEWARTPPFAAAEVHYRVDAELEADGALEGWLEMICTGYFASSYQAYYERFGRDELRRDVQETLSALIPGARLIDAERSKPDTGNIWRAFFALPGQSGESDQRQTLHFPAGSPVMLGVGDDERRETARFLWPLTWRVSGKIGLPSGWHVEEAPRAFDLHTDPYEVRASWAVKDGVCLPVYEAHVTRNLLEPSAHPSVWRGAQSLTTWLRKPLRLARGVALPPAVAEPATLEKFPLMPTGEGQLALVEQRFPDTGNRVARRAALNKTMDYFPDDAVTLFNARTHLALLDWDEDKAEEAVRSLRGITASPNAKVNEETIWWARYMTGVILSSSGKREEALRELEAVIHRPSLSPYRRSWACFQASDVLEKLEQRDRALELAREGLALHELENTPLLLAQCASLLFHLNKQADLKKVVDGVVEAHGAKAAPALARLATVAGSWASDGHAERTREVVALLEGLPTEVLAAEVGAALAQAKATVASVGIAAALQRDLQSFLEKNPQSDALKPPADGWPATLELCSKAFAKAGTDLDSDLGYRLALRMIAAFPPDPQFSAWLWQTAAHLENYERNQKAGAVSPLLELLFSLAKRLPKADDHYFEMRFLEGRLHERRYQDWKSAAAIYEEIIADKAMPESFRSSAVTRLADCHQELGDWKRTAATLSTLESLINYGSAADGLARAAHLFLEMGKPDEALRLLRIVASSRDFALKHSAMPEALREFLDVAKDEKKAKALWQATPKWWPVWNELRTTLGIEDKEIEPLIVDLESAGAIIKQAVQDKDPATAARVFRQVIHGARWHPARVVDVAWLSVFQLPALFPEQNQSLLGLVQAVLDDFVPVSDDQRRSRFMYLTISHMDRDSGEQALKHVHEYFTSFPADEHAVTFVMARLWGAVALNVKEEQGKAITALERTLASKELRVERAQSVRFLADLYRAVGNSGKEAALLKDSLTHPAISSDAQQAAALKQRLEQLGVGSAYARAVKRWLSRNAPPWFNYAKPKDLEVFGREELHANIQATSEQRRLVENMKVYLLAAADESLQPEQMDEWWTRGFNLVLALRVMKESRWRDELNALLDDAEAPAAFKETTLRVAYFQAADHERKGLLTHLRSKLPAAQISAFSRDRMAAADAVINLDLDNPGKAAEIIQAQLKKRDADLFGFMVSKLTARAVEYGKLPVLEVLADILAQARSAGTVDAAALQAMRLEVLRTISTVRRLLPVNEALAAVVLKNPVSQPVQKAQLPDLIGAISYPQLPSRLFLDWIHRQLQLGKRPCDDLGNWFGYLDACSELGTEVTWELRRELIDAAVKAAADDETRSEVVGLAASGTDIDSTVERTHLLQVLKPWRTAAAMPRAYGQIRLLEAHMAQRLGQNVDFQALAGILKSDGGLAERLAGMRLHDALHSGHAAGVGAALDKLGSDAMLQPGNLPAVIRALRLCGRDAELELALEAAKEELYQAILMSWTGVDNNSVRQAVSLAEALADPSVLPGEWLGFVNDAYPERHDQLILTMRVARLKKDWPAVLTAATEAVEKFPSFYTNYWVKAQALWELNRRDEAIAPLRIYAKFCHDEEDHPNAMKWLKEAGE